MGCEEIPLASKVMRTSIVAVGGSADFDVKGFDSSGANAEQRRAMILSFDQVVVMLSGKSLQNSKLAQCRPDWNS